MNTDDCRRKINFSWKLYDAATWQITLNIDTNDNKFVEVETDVLLSVRIGDMQIASFGEAAKFCFRRRYATWVAGIHLQNIRWEDVIKETIKVYSDTDIGHCNAQQAGFHISEKSCIMMHKPLMTFTTAKQRKTENSFLDKIQSGYIRIIIIL